MYKIQFNTKYILLLLFLTVSNFLIAQERNTHYGKELKGMKKLSYKVRVILNDNQKLKGYLQEIKSTSIVLSSVKHISINRKQIESIEIPVTQIKNFKIAKSNQLLKDLLISEGAVIVALIIADYFYSAVLGKTWGGEVSIIGTFFSLFTVPPAAFLINRLQRYKVELNGDQEKYSEEIEGMHLYLKKKSQKLKLQLIRV